MKEQLVNYLKAGFPIMAMNTVETSRSVSEVIRIVKEWNIELKELNANQALKKYGYQIKVWDYSSGWKIIDLETEAESPVYMNGTKDPVKALTFLTDNKELEECPAGIYILQNHHFSWDDPMQKAQICSALTDYAKKRSSIPYHHVIFVGPYAHIPTEISHLFQIVDFQLPNKQDLIELVSKFEKVVKKKMKKDDLKDIANAASGMTMYEAENSFRSAIISSKGKDIDPKIIQKEKAQAVKKSGFLEYEESEFGITDVGGLENLKLWLEDLSKIYHKMEEAEKYGLSMPKGVMVTGISGTGKSLIAKVIANIFNVPLFRCDIGKVFGSLVGETEKNTIQLFKQIDGVSPCVILLDEIEKSLSGMESSGASDAGVTARLIGRLLTYLQDKTSSSFFVATANDISKLPPELLRKGRFNQIWFVDLPEANERESIFKIHIEKTKRKPENYDVKALVDSTKGCTGAEIEGFITDAMYKAFSEGVEYTTAHILSAIKNTPLLSVTKEKEVTALRNWAKGRARIANYTEEHHPAWFEEDPAGSMTVTE